MLEYKDPKVYGIIDIFKWWFKNQQKDKPYLQATNYHKIRNANVLPKNKDVEVYYTYGKELEFLRTRIFDLQTEILELEKSDLKQYYFTEVTFKIFDLKKELRNMQNRINYLEKANPDTRKVIMSFRLFKKVIDSYNKKAVRAIVNDGSSINLGNNLGYMYIQKIKITNPFSSANIDWKASNEFKKELIDRGDLPKDKEHPEGKEWIQYYTSTHYLRLAWAKNYGVCKVPNGRVYGFYPPTSNKTAGSYYDVFNTARKADEFFEDRFISYDKNAES